jgi:hypothetical protein
MVVTFKNWLPTHVRHAPEQRLSEAVLLALVLLVLMFVTIQSTAMVEAML